VELYTAPTPDIALPAKRARRRGERGQNILEFALIAPIFLSLVFGIVDFGLGLRAWISITNAAREGARVGAIRGDCDAIKQQVIDTSGGLVDPGTVDDQVTIDPAGCDGTAGDSVTVTVSYEYDPITPLGGLLSIFGGGGLAGSFNIESTSDMRVE
jgi:Flp pilus assembly protein TadG